jgi:hypothetical protein
MFVVRINILQVKLSAFLRRLTSPFNHFNMAIEKKAVQFERRNNVQMHDY